MISNFKTGDQAGGASSAYSFKGTGKGAMGRLTELYLHSDGVASIDVYLDKNGDGDLDAGEYKLTSSPVALAAGANTEL